MSEQSILTSTFSTLFLISLAIFIWTRRARRVGWAFGLSLAFMVVAAGGLVFTAFAGLYTDALFFAETGFLQVFWTRTFARIVAYATAALVAFLLVWIVTIIPMKTFAALEDELERKVRRAVGGVRLAAALLTAHLVGLGAAGLSIRLLSAVQQVGSSTYRDPIFGHSLSFYLFTYPVIRSLLGLLAGIALGGLFVVGVSLLVAGTMTRDADVRRSLLSRLNVFISLLLIIAAAGVWFSMYDLLFQSNGVVFGVSSADQVVRIPLIKVTAAGILACAGIFLAAVFKPRLANIRFLGWAGAVTLITYVLLVSGVPALYQRFVVKPNELSRETQYLTNNITATNQAFGLADLNIVNDIGADTGLTLKSVTANEDLLRNIRLWDWRALADTNEQLQSIRSYYKFYDIDIDRYKVAGSPKEVMIAARELDQSLLPDNSRSFVNDRLVYTHGFGAVVNGVSDFSTEGAPVYQVRDIPPVSAQGFIPVTEPRIYYGENNSGYAIVGGTTAEFDYPQGDSKKEYFYTGTGGIQLSFINRLAFAFVERDMNLLISGQINSSSRIMVHRNLQERIQHIAPFLDVDSDPYLVVDAAGKLYWFGQGYTTSQYFPYSEYYDTGVEMDGKVVNYIRNSFMYVVDAFNGTTRFYLVDDTDPIIATLDRVYPGMFIPVGDAPDFVKEHYRYPAGLGELQGRVLARYHMTDPRTFYGQEDKWAVAKERYLGTDSAIEPYYIYFKLPGASEKTFSLVTPFTPSGKDNLVALLVISSDLASQQRVSVIKFSQDRAVFGPFQVEARIDQDAEISKSLSLWNQQGSQVLRGNMLVLPIDGTLLYIEPIYLQSSSSKMPQIKKVVAATKDKLVWGDNLDQALSALLGTTVTVGGSGNTPTDPGTGTTPGTDTPDPGTTPGTVTEEQKALIAEAVTYMTQYQTFTSQGDFVKAGEALTALEAVLAKLSALQTAP